ncbi:MAG: bifunctional hydroxymethylpyrimidine kinase/phosphomethylpyrimidine kinase [Bacteroidales bacterium]|nr:bifunctional hydroxymethylpyrimidine kinase/phosphomethylpyrimidine kinase [Bacteroidales bacterium]
MRKTTFVLTIAGSDSCGGAGIQADLKTFSSLGVYGSSVITAVTAQNTLGVKDIQAINPQIVASQLDSVLTDFDIKAIKIGMIFTSANVIAISERLASHNYHGKIVLDPVMVSTQGNDLILSQTMAAICENLFPISDLITPNLREAEAILDMKITNVEDMKTAAQLLVTKYDLKAVLVKGGHLEGSKITDVLLAGSNFTTFQSDKINTRNTHGTGCTLSSAIAAYLAKNQDIETACRNAKTYIHHAIASAQDIDLGHGNGSVNHFFNPIPLMTF